MKITKLHERPNTDFTKRSFKKYDEFQKLIHELNKAEIPQETARPINLEIDKINSFSGNKKHFLRHIRKGMSSILRLTEKDLKIVPRNYYRNMWQMIGLSAFGVPFGVVFGAIMGNMAFIGIGIPIGMVLGIAIGTSKDKKAKEEGKQLDFEIKF